MDDINLLPEELRKKQKKSLDDRGDFDMSEIEFTSGEKLKNDFDNGKVSHSNNSSSWNQFKQNKNVQTSVLNREQLEKENQIFNPENKNFSKQDHSIEFSNNKKDKLFSRKNDDGVISFPKQELMQQQVKSIEPNFVNPQELDNNLKTKTQEKKIIYQKEKQNTSIRNNEKISAKSKASIFNNIFKKLNKFFVKKQDVVEEKLNVNLLPETQESAIRNNIAFTLILVLTLSLLVILIAYFAINMYKMSIMKESNNLDAKIEKSLNNLNNYDKIVKDVETWEIKSNKVQELFSHHIYWTKFFEAIEDNTLPSVRFSSFAGGLNGNLVLSATAPDYQTVVRQWMHLKRAKNFAKNVIISGASLSAAEDKKNLNVSFTITLDLVDDIFFKTDNK